MANDKIERCPKCGAGDIGNCGYYGCETPRETCPLTEAERAALAIAKASKARPSTRIRSDQFKDGGVR